MMNASFPRFRIVDGGRRRRPKRLQPSQSVAIGILWALRAGEDAARRVAALSDRYAFELRHLLAAVGSSHYDDLAHEIGIPREFLERRFVVHFTGGAKVYLTMSPNGRRRYRPNGWTISAIRAAGCQEGQQNAVRSTFR